MNVTFPCPRCERTARATFARRDGALECPWCHARIQAPPEAFGAPERPTESADNPYESPAADGASPTLRRCLVCPSKDLFVRKDFPQRLGVSIVVLGFFASCVTWAMHYVYATFAVLFGTALLDVLLYVSFGEAVQCYRCGATYRNLDGATDYPAFDLETHERHRQQTARLKNAAP